MFRRITIIILLFSIFSALSVSSQENAIPVDIQYALLIKILSFDRAITRNSRDKIVIGILYQSRFITSKNTKDEFVAAIEKTPDASVDGRRIEYKLIDIMTIPSENALEYDDVDVFYVTPLRALSISAITDISRERKILSVTGVPAYCEEGITVGIGQKSEKPQIIINLESMKAEGAEFSSQLLKLAKVM